MDVGTSVLGALEGRENVLGLPAASRVCLLVVDGLGSRQLADHAALAPFLTEVVDAEPIDAAVPTTTATNLATLMTGVPPGRHGMTGATVAVPGHTRPMSLLKWRLQGVGPHVDLVDTFVPQHVQPLPTMLERARTADLSPVVVGPVEHAGTGLNRAILRGGRLWPADEVDAIVAGVHESLAGRARRFAYAYYGRLDGAGHLAGVDSDEWRAELEAVDGLVSRLAACMPQEAVLVVTADHGMIDLEPSGFVNVDDEPDLLGGVRVVAGEPRFRHIHTLPGSAGAVRERWGAALGDDAWVLDRDGAVAAGWFGPIVDPAAAARIGDVVVAARAPIGIVQQSVDPKQAELRGHHGSVTAAEREVPLVRVQGATPLPPRTAH